MNLRDLFECHYGSIWRLLRRLGVRQAHLDDAAQEVFWVAARRLGDIVPGRDHAFLYGVALRVASTQTRREAVLPVCEPSYFPRLVDPRPSPEEQVQARQARELLDEVLDRLPMDLRTVFVLHELEELEIRQIAQIEGIPAGTVSSRLRRARSEFSLIAKRLRATIQGQGG